MNWRTRARARRTAEIATALAIAAVALFPILWGLSTSLKPANRILEFPPEIIPSTPTLEHYFFLFETGIGRPILNSLVVSFFSVAFSLILGTLAGYALARFDFKGKAGVMLTIVAVMSIPLPSLTVPTFILLALLDLNDTLVGLVILYTAYQLPITVWILYGYFRTLPRELESAAMIDGYSRLQVLRKIVVPLSGPGLIASGLFVLTFAWNDFVVAVAMLSSAENRTLPLAIYNYLGFFGREWGPLTASAMVATVPVIVVFVIFQRYFLSGMTGGSVKG
jgi:multiple sugar transport system permease protein